MSVFWVVTERMLVIITDILGQPFGPIFKGQPVKGDWILEDGTNWMSWNISQQTPILQCVKTQKSKDLIYTMVEAWNLK